MTDIIEADTLTDGGPGAGSELERTTANGGTVGRVAIGFRSDIADGLVGGKGRWKVGVEFTSTVSAPHESGREAGGGAGTSRATNSFVITVSAIETGKLSTEVEIEPFREEN